MSCYCPNPIVLRHLLKNARYCNPRRSTIAFSYSTANEDIVVPKRIPRGPTDILEALASTVKRDPTAAHYKFHDDPFLIPSSNQAKRSYALAQEAGRKAAMWIKQEHADLFQHRVAEPFIQAFAPAEKLTENTPATEDLLKQYINSSQVSNAINIYNKLENVTPEMKQSFLELLCFYNEEDQIGEELVEERWFRAGMKGVGERARKTWKDNGLAEKVFNSIEPKTAEAYCALVCGMANYGQVEGANEYFNQMQAKGFVPNLATYNSILKVAGSLKESAELKWNLIQETLTNMATAKVNPTVLTLNAALESIATIPVNRLAREAASKLLSEFRVAGIQPSLASYYYVLRIFCREKGPTSNILIDILQELEKGIPPVQDVQDVAFFPQAMDVCHHHLQDVGLARRLDALLTSRPEFNVLIGDSYKESIYYRNYLQLVSKTETPEALMETYHRLVPNIYTPEQRVFEEILVTMRECSAAHYVPELWADAVYMELAGKDSVIELVLEALATGNPASGNEAKSEDEALVDPVLTTAKAVYTHVEQLIADAKTRDRPLQLRWTGSMLGHLMKVYLNHDDFQAACQVMTKANELKMKTTGFVPVETLERLLDRCVELGNAPMALMTVDYAADMGFDQSGSMAAKISSSSLPLDDRQAKTLQSIIDKSPSVMQNS